MPQNTNQGKAYSLDELLRLGSINSFGPYNGAIMGALMEGRELRSKAIKLEKENTELKAALGEAMHEKFISEVKKDRKDK